jgi:putative nucleotidyltransferase with HDIG domain
MEARDRDPDASEPTEAPAAPPRALRAYVALVILAGAVMLLHSAATLIKLSHPWQWMLLGGCGIVTGSFAVNIAFVSASISVADTFSIATALLFGPGAAAVVLATDTGVLSLRKGHRWDRVAFNMAAPALSIWTAAQVFFGISGGGPLAQGHLPAASLIGPLACLTLVYFALNSGFTAVAVGLEARRSVFRIWREHFLWLAIGYLAAGSMAFCVVLLCQLFSLVAVIVVAPLLAVFYLTFRSSFGRVEDAKRHLGDLDRLYLSTVETLAMAIDAKDDVTHNHVRRVQAYAIGLARALGVTDDLTIKAIEAAALLHDTGKLAVPEHILNKPGKLTESEFEQMKMHVDVGADILSLVEFPYPVVPIVRCHHENWDGSGYPRALSGQDIPLGARILSVVDCYDALTSDRPYRRRMTEEAALGILRERRGRMYDPDVVDTFIAVYQSIVVDLPDMPEHRQALKRISESQSQSRSGLEVSQPAQAAAATGNVLAFVSLSRLAKGEVTVADVLALSSNLIRDIVPGATGAWYLADESSDRLTVVDSFGPAAGSLAGATIGIGDRLSGWVAATRQAVFDSDAALDFDASPHDGGTLANLQRCTSVPLMLGTTLVGVLSVYGAAGVCDQNRGRLLEMVAPHVASALHAAKAASAARVGAAGRTAESTAPGRESHLTLIH